MDKRVELALWTRRFSTMVDSGVSLVHCMKLLEEEATSGALRDLTRTLRAKVEAGDTLSDAMRTWPDIFSEDYVGSIRAGEYGGILDRTMRRLVLRMDAGRMAPNPSEGAPVTRAELAEWFWRLAAMLEAGVPLLTAIQRLSELGHPVLREVARQMHQEINAGYSIAPMSNREEAPDMPQLAMWRHPGIFGPTVRQLVGMSVWFGPVVSRLKTVSELLDYEAGLEAAGDLPSLSAEQADAPAPVAPGAAHPVIHRVNELIKTLLRSGAEWADLKPAEEDTGVAVLQKGGGEVVLTEQLDFYPQVLRRLKLLAGLDPLARDEEGYRRSQIHVRVDDKEYKLLVRTGGDRLVLSVGAETDTVQL